MAFSDWLDRWFSRREKSPQLVPFYDVDSQRVVRIPACELAPGTVEVKVQGIDGLVWIDPSKLRPADIRNAPLSEDLRFYIRQIERSFREHRDISFEAWEEGFRRDANPAQEIALWSHAADVYSEFADSEPSPDRRKEMYQCIITCLTTSTESVWLVLRPSVLSNEEADRIVRRFYGVGAEPDKDDGG